MEPIRPPERLETARLLLRPTIAADAPAIFDYARDEEATAFMNFARQRTLAEAEAFARRCAECWSDGDAFSWAVGVRATGEIAGFIELRLAPPKADFGYILRRAFWGHGYASEAAGAVVRWTIAHPAIFRVWATCHPDNKRSMRVLEKAGLRFEARLANWEARPNKGEPAADSLVYALTRPAPA